MDGWLIKTNDGYRGPAASLLYSTPARAVRALEGWPGNEKAYVVRVRVIEDHREEQVRHSGEMTLNIHNPQEQQDIK